MVVEREAESSRTTVKARNVEVASRARWSYSLLQPSFLFRVLDFFFLLNTFQVFFVE